MSLTPSQVAARAHLLAAFYHLFHDDAFFAAVNAPPPPTEIAAPSDVKLQRIHHKLIEARMTGLVDC